MFDEPFYFVVHFCRFHNGSRVKSSERIIISGPPQKPLLIIKNVEVGNAGEYKCHVFNQQGHVKHEVEFIVKVIGKQYNTLMLKNITQ